MKYDVVAAVNNDNKKRRLILLAVCLEATKLFTENTIK